MFEFEKAMEKSKTLTLKLDLETLAEFSVSAQVHRARSVSSFLHEYVVRQINEARRMVAPAEFERRVEEQKAAILARSSAKRQERQINGGGYIPVAPKSKSPGIPMLKPKEPIKKKRVTK